MTTALEKYKQLFTETGVDFEEKVDSSGTLLILAVHEHKKVVGYAGFTAELSFDTSGSLLHIGLYE